MINLPRKNTKAEFEEFNNRSQEALIPRAASVESLRLTPIRKPTRDGRILLGVSV